MHVQAVAGAITAAGGRAHAIILNLETSAGANQLIAQSIEILGAIDVAIHNVGGTIWAKPFWKYEEHQIEKEISRSLWPTLWGCRAVIPPMRARKKAQSSTSVR
jgi:dihydroxycyclohexadiene carboxylate dehydrogenase